MRYAAKCDVHHAAVRDALRELGFRVLDTSRYPGFVDLLARRHHQWWLIEVKTAQNKAGRVSLTASQQQLMDEGWPLVILRTRDEAIAWAQGQKGHTT
jgi:Holliday junction resolvase-like predicted endonuclease